VSRAALLIILGAGLTGAAPAPVTTAEIGPLPAARQQTSSPRIRIRGFANGLGRADFALWLEQHPDSDARRSRRPPPDAGITAMLNSTSIEFASADRDRDGRVSARELARLILQPTAAV
jgi:hypothetical protein